MKLTPNESEEIPRTHDWIIKLAEEISASSTINNDLKALTFEAAVQFVAGPINWFHPTPPSRPVPPPGRQ
jgi:hypothetical protein